MAPYPAVGAAAAEEAGTEWNWRGEVEHDLRQQFSTDYDDTQSLGRRYRRQDEIGTPLAITIDFDSLEDHAATIRDRDSMEQVRVTLDQLATVCAERLGVDG